MSQCKEPSLVEYARHYGLSVNHLERSPLEVLPPPDNSTSQLDEEMIWQQLRERAASHPLQSNTKLKDQQNRVRDPITPPLLPRSPSPHPYEPSSETGHLDLLSERSSPARQELDSINDLLLETNLADVIERRAKLGRGDQQTPISDINSIGDLYSPLKGISDTPPPRLQKRNCRENLKIEGPLTPPASDRPPPWDIKKVSFSEAMHDIIPVLPPPIADPEDLSPEDIDMLFAEQIAPIAAKVDREIEQEQLQEADTTSRVPVPVMDFAKTIPPWILPVSGTMSEWMIKFMCDIKEEYLKEVPSWDINRETEKTKLSWVPFPMSLGRFELQDSIEDDGSLSAYIEDPEPLDPDTLTWKPPGLRILDEIHESTTKVARNGTHSSRELPHPTIDTTVPLNRPGSAEMEYAVTDALDQFVGVRRGELRKSHEPKKVQPPQPTATSSADARTAYPPTEQNVAQKSHLEMPKPQLRVSDARRYFVASTSFLSNRRLAHHIKELYPSAEYIERDFTLYHPQIAGAEGCPVPPKNADDLSDEADLILSPSTGLIITSLPKIKQRSLPGQTTHSLVRERIGRTATRYERLVILVSRSSLMSNDDDSSLESLDESDCEALTSLIAFLNHIPILSESEMILVDGNISALAAWIASLMVKYSSEDTVTLLQEETQWEVFLRQAGMNAFAAQVILADMKAAEDNDNSAWDLRRLILTSPEERCQRFEGLLGGRGILERVGKVLDARW